jgi:UDP-GlcNAc:undecaprenyl-phosphate GlcNAc-1-phosphate transferase
VQLVAFFAVGVYRGNWHLFGLDDALMTLKGVVLGTSVAALFALALYGWTVDPKMIFVYYALLLTLFVTLIRGSLRLALRFLR